MEKLASYGIPREELISMICDIGSYHVTLVELTELFHKYGDIVKDGKVLEENKKRDSYWTE